MSEETARAIETTPVDSPQSEGCATSEKSCQTEDLLDIDYTEQKPVDQVRDLPKEESSKDQALPSPEKSTTAKSRPTTYIQHRAMFTDGWNSVWHFVFGFLALQYPIFVSIFIVYQFLNIYEVNVFVDILEFLVGHTVACGVFVLTI
jgi:hypothetical protein